MVQRRQIRTMPLDSAGLCTTSYDVLELSEFVLPGWSVVNSTRLWFRDGSYMFVYLWERGDRSPRIETQILAVPDLLGTGSNVGQGLYASTRDPPDVEASLHISDSWQAKPQRDICFSPWRGGSRDLLCSRLRSRLLP
ncbi:unnamed protein product [Symbiodinium sp. CCMP2592]|nr:unnamed protein product [Symbiodinium sp. CCMP2592]